MNIDPHVELAWFQDTEWWKFYQSVAPFRIESSDKKEPPFGKWLVAFDIRTGRYTSATFIFSPSRRETYHEQLGRRIRLLLEVHTGVIWMPYKQGLQWKCLYCGSANNDREDRNRLTQCKYCGAPRPVVKKSWTGGVATTVRPRGAAATYVATTYFTPEVPAEIYPPVHLARKPEGFTDRVLCY